MGSLKGKVALVTGASRGIGKGVAKALGAEGAVVYLTGRSYKKGDETVPLGGTITETATLVTKAGGTGIAIRCDHRNDNEVKAVFDQIQADHGRLDILVNNAWAAYQMLQGVKGLGSFTQRFWKGSPALWDFILDVGARSHYVASVMAAAMMVEQNEGLIVHIAGQTGEEYHSNVLYGVNNAAVHKMAADMAHEVQKHNIAVVSLVPGRVWTEMVQKSMSSHKKKPPFCESPEFVGRAVAALALDTNLMSRSGSLFHTRALAVEYGFTDVDGKQPPMVEH